MSDEGELGAAVAARLKSGSRKDYDLVQMLVGRAQKTQEWVFGDMIMRIIWALLTDEAQKFKAAVEVTERRARGANDHPQGIAGSRW